MNNQSNGNENSSLQICNESYDYERVMRAFRGEAFKTTNNNQQNSNNNQQNSNNNQQNSNNNQQNSNNNGNKN